MCRPLSQAMDNLFELHDWPAPLQMMDAAVNYYELDDERYLRLRIRVNDRLIKDKRIDDLYASRHYGQLMLYVSAFQFLVNKLYDTIVPFNRAKINYVSNHEILRFSNRTYHHFYLSIIYLKIGRAKLGRMNFALY